MGTVKGDSISVVPVYYQEKTDQREERRVYNR